MEKNIYSVSDYYIKAKVPQKTCPLDWLVAFYREYDGKLVCLDNKLMSYILNDCKYDEVHETPYDGFKQTFTVIWKATDTWPETRVVISVYGREPIEKGEDGYIVDNVANYYIIEELKADDILVNNQQYAQNALDDKQMIFLVADELENTNNI